MMLFTKDTALTLNSIRSYEKNVHRFNKSDLDIAFLEKCKLYGIFPKFMEFKLHNAKYQFSNQYKLFKRELLEMVIKEHNSNRRKTRSLFEKARH